MVPMIDCLSMLFKIDLLIKRYRFLESRPLSASWELLRVKQEQESTPLETEVRERRIERFFYI